MSALCPIQEQLHGTHYYYVQSKHVASNKVALCTCVASFTGSKDDDFFFSEAER